MVTITNIKCETLWVPEKVRAQPHVTHIKVVKQRSIPVLKLNNIIIKYIEYVYYI
jgi:hypothetical protein